MRGGVVYVARTMLGGHVFSVRFPRLRKTGFRAWLAMQLVGLAVTLAGEVHARPGDITED